MSKSVTLYYCDGASNKVYQTSIEASGSGYVVTFAFGRKGSTLTTGTKTTFPVTLAEAEKIHSKLVREKQAKGYAEGADSTPYQHTDKEQRATDVLPMLLNPIDESEVEGLVADTSYVMQEKHDGRRILIRKDKDGIVGINRKGLTVGLPQNIVAAAEKLHYQADFTLDGELVGDRYFAFDILKIYGNDTRELPYGERYYKLVQVLGHQLPDAMTQRGFLVTADITPVAWHGTRTAKRAALADLIARKREGVVFKHIGSKYKAGRPNSGGHNLKFKFYETTTVRVVKVNAKRSVSVGVVDGKRGVTVGNVTIPPNHVVPKVGDMVEVRYLNYNEGGSLYQPTFLGKRDDKDEADQLSTLKRKVADDEDEDA